MTSILLFIAAVALFAAFAAEARNIGRQCEAVQK
jgi:hypothetical protein